MSLQSEPVVKIPPTRFAHGFEVSASDIDELGHVSNIAYVRWIQDCAVAHSIAVGLDVSAYLALGAVFVVRRHEIDYLRPVVRGDRVEVRTWIGTVHAAKCNRATEVVKVCDDGAEIVAARAVTTWGYIEIATGRPTRIPASVRTAFGVALARAV